MAFSAHAFWSGHIFFMCASFPNSSWPTMMIFSGAPFAHLCKSKVQSCFCTNKCGIICAVSNNRSNCHDRTRDLLSLTNSRRVRFMRPYGGMLPEWKCCQFQCCQFPIIGHWYWLLATLATFSYFHNSVMRSDAFFPCARCGARRNKHHKGEIQHGRIGRRSPK